MKNLLLYIGIILLAIYIISPLDAHPLFLDDLIASAVLFYLIYKHRLTKKGHHYTHTYEKEPKTEKTITVDDAYRLLGVGPDASVDEIKKAYREKIAMNHPDKVSHLSKELQDKARELTLRLNRALEIIKEHRNMD